MITVAEVIEIHDRLIYETDGSPGLRDMGLLESAVLGCYQSYDTIDLYPTVIEKSARMAYAICKNHPFIDGNKRSAVVAMLVLLRMNNIELTYSQNELVSLAGAVRPAAYKIPSPDGISSFKYGLGKSASIPLDFNILLILMFINFASNLKTNPGIFNMDASYTESGDSSPL